MWQKFPFCRCGNLTCGEVKNIKQQYSTDQVKIQFNSIVDSIVDTIQITSSQTRWKFILIQSGFNSGYNTDYIITDQVKIHFNSILDSIQITAQHNTAQTRWKFNWWFKSEYLFFLLLIWSCCLQQQQKNMFIPIQFDFPLDCKPGSVFPHGEQEIPFLHQLRECHLQRLHNWENLQCSQVNTEKTNNI